MLGKDVNKNEDISQLKKYEAPAIIFESIISTRAGSPVIESDAPQPPAQENSIDLFPTD